MRTFWAQPLRRQLFTANLLLLVPVLTVTVWFGLTTLRERRVELGDEARAVAMTTAAYVNRDVLNWDRMAQRLTADPGVRALDRERANDLLARVVVGRPAILRMVLTDLTGAEVARVDSSDDGLEGGAWPERVVATRNRVVVPVTTSASGKIKFVVFGYPVAHGHSEQTGTLGIYLNLQNLQEAFVALPLPPDSVVSIADHSGRILSRNIEPEKYIGRLLYDLPRPQGGALGMANRSGVDGISRMYGEAEVEAGPWIVSVGIPVSVASERATSLLTRSFTLLALGLAGWFMVALVFSRRLGDSVSHLDANAQRIARGDFSAMDEKPMLSRELADLQAAFGRMLQRFNDTRQVLDSQMAEERRIRQELESLQGQVIRQERLAAVGQLVSGVAHEINNPLQAILGFAELLQMQPDVPESVKGDLRLIQKESSRACGIIRNLALFARQQPGEAAPVRLIDVITSVAELRQRRLESEDIELRIEDTSTQEVMAVLTELQQVVLNFVVNAEQSVVNSGRLPGRITIRTYDREGFTVLEVEDTGPGIPVEHEAKLFQPFFTTKPVGQGTGLGLSVSYGIVDSMGGQIGYRRAPAGGAVFYFELQAVTDSEE